MYQYNFQEVQRSGGPGPIIAYFFIGHDDCPWKGMTCSWSRNSKRYVCQNCKAVAGLRTTEFLKDAKEMIESGLRENP